MVFGKGIDKFLKEKRMESEKMDRETKLELEVRQCSSMILNLKKPCWTNLGTVDSTKTDITRMEITSGEEIICFHTKKPCVLYSVDSWPHVLYSCLERCPSSKDSVVKYRVKGIKKEYMFHVSEIEKIEDK